MACSFISKYDILGSARVLLTNEANKEAAITTQLFIIPSSNPSNYVPSHITRSFKVQINLET